jgi:hypothetical protein
LFGADDAPAALLPNGHVLFTADAGPTVGTFAPPTELFDFDPDTDTIVEVPSPIPDLRGIPAYYTRMLILPTGQVLFSDADTQLWVYTPSGFVRNKSRPRIGAIKYRGAGIFTLKGRRLNGQSAGSAYGDDVESDENYPIVSLTDENGNVFYGRTTNWSTTDVATAALRETVDFTLPPSLVKPGIYTVTVSGAGISSFNPVSIRITAKQIASR